MPLYPPPTSGTGGSFPGPLGFFGAAPVAQPTGYTWAYTTENHALPAYIPNVQSSPFVGGLLDLLQAARLADLNAVRVALENDRVFTERLAQQHNQLCTDLKAMGLIA
jgi:hypothetical protein